MNKKIINEIKIFSKERNWEKFHTGENLAKSISIEAGELLELFQWESEVKSIDNLKDELADIFIYSIQLAEKYQLDIESIIMNKMKKNKEKYPINKSYGSAKKYSEF